MLQHNIPENFGLSTFRQLFEIFQHKGFTFYNILLTFFILPGYHN